MSDFTATSDLEAVNAILSSIGESPVNTIYGEVPADVSLALTKLRNKSRAIQAVGWRFNTDYDITLPLDTDGYINLPSNILRVVSKDDRDVVTRGSRLYHSVNHTFVFTASPTLDLSYFLPFRELPESARQYILVAAAREFQDSTLGDESLHRVTMDDEKAAKQQFLQADAGEATYNILDRSPTAQRVFRSRTRT